MSLGTLYRGRYMSLCRKHYDANRRAPSRPA
jgi:hypothetical protein